MRIVYFFFNDTATTEIYTLSLHDALPISLVYLVAFELERFDLRYELGTEHPRLGWSPRSEEHTSELQSRLHLVCRLLLEKKKNKDLTRVPAHAHCDTDAIAASLSRIDHTV